MLRAAWNAMTAFEACAQKLRPLGALRRRALARCLERIRFEQQTVRGSNPRSLAYLCGLRERGHPAKSKIEPEAQTLFRLLDVARETMHHARQSGIGPI